MSILGTIYSVPNQHNKIECIKKMREAIIDNDGHNLGLKESKEACDAFFMGGHYVDGTFRYEFPNEASLDRLIKAGFEVKDVTGIPKQEHKKTLLVIRHLVQDAMDNDDAEAFEALSPAFKLFLKRSKP
jgi:hypothetical protein